MAARFSSERFRGPANLAILIAALLIANRWTWLCVFEVNKPLFSCQYGTPVSELAVYLGLAGIVWLLLWKSPEGAGWIQLWRQNPILIAFLALCGISVFWSIAPVSTVYRFLVAVLCSVTASYLGMQLTELQWIRRLAVFFGVVIVLSYLLVWLLPGAAIMHTQGLEGSWRGAFSHRNYAGSILAAGAGTLLLGSLSLRRIRERAACAILLLLDVMLIALTKSATGVILLVLMLSLTVIAAAWQHYRERLQSRHYLVAGGILAALTVLAAIARGRILELLGRNASLTGRIPVWRYLVERVMEQNPWLGFGFWTFWRFQNLRRETQAAVGWSFEVIDAHSGYMDTFLFLGVIGLALLLAILGRALLQAARHGLGSRSPASLWPVVTVAYVALANLTISFILQFESFHWFLLVAAIFAVSAAPARKHNPAAGPDGAGGT